MKRTGFDERRDQHIADHDQAPRGHGSEFMCRAIGCPNRFTVCSSSLCSAHAWEEPRDWPEITQREQWAETERARALSDTASDAAYVDKPAVIEALRRFSSRLVTNRDDPKAWAKRLREREQAGEQIGTANKAAWRNALHERVPKTAKEPDRD